VKTLLLGLLAWGGLSQNANQPVVDPQVLETRIFNAINAERTQRRLKPLKTDTRLTNLARAHSRDMALRAFFDHVNPDGKSSVQRARTAGLECRRPLDDRYYLGLGENIFQNNLYDRVIFRNDKPSYEWKPVDEIVKSTVEGWMNSPGHRQVILTAGYLNTGVGVAVAPNDQILITQEFC
jgi:uncharacterized protein YkwD